MMVRQYTCYDCIHFSGRICRITGCGTVPDMKACSEFVLDEAYYKSRIDDY